MRARIPVLVWTICMLVASDRWHADVEAKAFGQFEDATLVVVYSATDEDAQIIISGGSEEPLRTVKVSGPGGLRPMSWKSKDGAGLGHQLIQDVDVMQLAVADENEGRDIAAQVQQRVQFYRGFGRAERRPREYRQAQIDRGGIQGVDRILQIEPEGFVGVETPRCGNQALRKIAIDAPIPGRIGIGKRVARHGTTKPQVIKLGALRT